MTSALLHMPHRGTSRHRGTAQLLADQVRFSLQDLWRSRIAFVFTFLFPLTWLLLIGVVAGNDTVDAASGVRIMQFVTPSAAVMGVLYATLPTVATSLAVARERGVLKRVRGTPLPAWIYLAGRVGAAVVLALGSLTVMLAAGVLAYDVQIVWRTALAFLLTVVVAIASFAACGLAIAMLARSSAVAQGASIAAAVVLSFLSGLFTVGGDPPAWQDRVASVFPLQPFTNAVEHQFDPFAHGAGWDRGALAMLGVWGLAGGLVAAWRFRWEPAAAKTPVRRYQPAAQATASADAVAGRRVAVAAPGRPTSARMLLDQARWTTRGTLRDLGSVFFAIVMPVALFAFVMVSSSGGATGPGGVPLGVYVGAGMTAWGVAVTAFINLPEQVAQARDRGVLKRLRGTPLTSAMYLAGRTASAVWIGLVTGVLIGAVGVLFFDLQLLWSGVLLAVGLLVLGTLTLAACGFALASAVPNGKAMTAVGLGILLPLAFFSDVFGFGDDTPQWMSTVGSLLPLKHLANSLSTALDPSGPAVSWPALAVLTAWLLVAGFVAVRAFSWQDRSRT